MQQTLHLPDDLMTLTGMASPGRAAISALRAALDAALSPVDPDAGARATTVYLGDDVLSALLQAGATDSTLPRFASGVIHAWAVAARKRERARGTKEDWGDVDVETLRPQQRQLVSQVLPLLRQKRLVFQEASTGIGKSRALATLAHVRCRAGDQVTIATPTIALMTQLVEEFLALGLPAPAVYLGRRHFIDRERLASVLDDGDAGVTPEDRQAVGAWDGKPIKGSPGARLAAQVPGLEWMIEDLHLLAPSIPLHLVSADDAEHAIYDALRSTWFEAPIRVTTHTFLAADMAMAQFGKPLVETYDCLLVDEAHLFEDAVSSAFSASLSLHTLRSFARHALNAHGPALRQYRALQAATRIADQCDATLQVVTSQARAGRFLVPRAGEPDLTPAERHLGDALRACCKAMTKDLDRLAEVPLPTLSAVRDARAACALAQANNPLMVVLSPVRRYPSILVGPRGLRGHFQRLWERTERAALLSGTLLVNTGSMGDSSGYMASLLHVPSDRLADAPPITAPWLYSTPHVWVPSLAGIEALIPPKSTGSADDADDATEDDPYYAAVASHVIAATRTAAGGTLVLCTSFRAIRALEARLALVKDRLIVQGGRASFASCETYFRGMAKTGARPIWLATGTAWTGLDLRDASVPATEDHLLTDVIIPRLPINPASSLHGNLRQRRMGLAMLRLEVALRLRQGMGRLVRAEGQPDRRLWVLDGRMWSPKAPHPHLTGPSKRALMAYPGLREIGE